MIENKPNRYFHVSSKENLYSILENGLIASIGERIEAVFLFPNKEEMDNALYNWLGEQFDDSEELVIFQIDLPSNFLVYRELDSNGEDFYEAHCYCDIPEEYITAVYDEMYNRIDVLSLSGSFEQEFE